MYFTDKYFTPKYFPKNYFSGIYLYISPPSPAVYLPQDYFPKGYFTNKYFLTGVYVPPPVFACYEYISSYSGPSSLPIIPFNIPNLSSYDSVQRGRFGDVLTVFFTLSSGLGIPFSIEGTPLYAVYDSASNLVSPPQAMNGWDSQPATTVRGYPTVDTSRFSGGGVYFVVGNFNLSDSSGLIKLTSVSITMLVLS